MALDRFAAYILTKNVIFLKLYYRKKKKNPKT